MNRWIATWKRALTDGGVSRSLFHRDDAIAVAYVDNCFEEGTLAFVNIDPYAVVTAEGGVVAFFSSLDEDDIVPEPSAGILPEKRGVVGIDAPVFPRNVESENFLGAQDLLFGGRPGGGRRNPRHN